MYASRYEHLTDGVHLVVPFLVTFWHFCNLQFRIPVDSPNYNILLLHIKRCIVDSLWGRETSTINNHLGEVNRNSVKFIYIGKKPSYPTLGPHPVK